MSKPLPIDALGRNQSRSMQIADEMYNQYGYDRFRIDGNYFDCEARAWKKGESVASVEVRASSVEMVMERLLAMVKTRAHLEKERALLKNAETQG